MPVPTDWVLASILATVIVAILRAMQTQAFVPGRFYTDMKAERDLAVDEARKAIEESHRLADTVSALSHRMTEVKEAIQTCRHGASE